VTKPAAFTASYTDWKLIRTRGCIQIVFEIPLEVADRVYQVLGGMPNAGHENWFAIAKIKEEAVMEEKAKKSWHELSMTQQAGMLSNDPAFQKFLRETTEFNHTDYPVMIRELCKVTSRKDILPDTEAGEMWKGLVSEYRAWGREPEVI
jgi:hypothetical protein